MSVDDPQPEFTLILNLPGSIGWRLWTGYRVMTNELVWCDECKRYDPPCSECHGSGWRLSSNEYQYGECETCGGASVKHAEAYFDLDIGAFK